MVAPQDDYGTPLHHDRIAGSECSGHKGRPLVDEKCITRICTVVWLRLKGVNYLGEQTMRASATHKGRARAAWSLTSRGQ